MGAGITRNLRFAHYASYDILSRDPSETTWIPKAPIFLQGDVAFIERSKVDFVKDAFIYVFEDGPTLVKRGPLLGQGASTPFVLQAVLSIDANGNYSGAAGSSVKAAAGNNSTPTFT